MSEIVWQDPPSTERGLGNGWVAEWVEELKTRPGQWALYPRKVRGTPVSKYGERFPGTEWTARKRDDGMLDVYGRWVGAS